MSWIDTAIVAVCLITVFSFGFVCRKYMKTISDFLTGGRVAGRYVLAVASGEAALGIGYIITNFDITYNSGVAVLPFWGRLAGIVGIFMALSGYCVYRFRQTRAMTMGQFLEMRYNRKFRIYAAVLQSVAGLLSYGIFPAITARVLIYFCGLPRYFYIGSWRFSTFVVLLTLVLAGAVLIIMLAGQISIMVTDCIQGIISYPFFLAICVYLLIGFSWQTEVLPALADRPAGESFLNPYDAEKLRDFNIAYVLIGIFGTIMNKMSWSNTQGYNVAGATPHEQKLAGVLGNWRAGFSGMMLVLLGISAYAYMNGNHYRSEAREVRAVLAAKVSEEITGAEITISQAEDAGQAVYEELSKNNPADAQKFNATYKQMLVPSAIKHFLPTGLLGALCVLMIFMALSCDTTTIHSWGSIIVQDVILPLRKTPFKPEQQLLLLRLSMLGVAVFAFFFSLFFSQIDYMVMFLAITSAIYLGGAGPCIVFGLYWKRGTTAAAFATLTCGAVLALGGFAVQNCWASDIYPFLERCDLVPVVSEIFATLSGPFEPYIKWRVTPTAFPINSQEIYFITLLISLLVYVIVSLCGRKTFNMDKLLHRGTYRIEGEELAKNDLSFKGIIRTLVGIDSEYTRGDKVLAWSVFIYSFIWGMGSWVTAVIWNAIDPWPLNYWANWFFLFNYILAFIVGIISSVWFFIGGIVDLRKLFKRLAEKRSDAGEDGRVS